MLVPAPAQHGCSRLGPATPAGHRAVKSGYRHIIPSRYVAEVDFPLWNFDTYFRTETTSELGASDVLGKWEGVHFRRRQVYFSVNWIPCCYAGFIFLPGAVWVKTYLHSVERTLGN